MKEKTNYTSCYWIIAILTFTILKNVHGEPEPLPRMIYADRLSDDSEKFLLIHRLKEIVALKREMAEEQNELTEAEDEIRDILVEKVRNERITHDEYSAEGAEMLPVPSAMVQHVPAHPGGKRTSSYMALCHFKICNMGRKRQTK